MEHSVEISKRVFNKLVSINHVAERVENTELTRKTYYNVLDVNLIQVENFVSCVSQYYIQDINA